MVSPDDEAPEQADRSTAVDAESPDNDSELTDNDSAGIAGEVHADPADEELIDDASVDDESVDDESGDDGAPEGGGTSRRRRRAYISGAVAGVLLAIVIAVALIQLPYYRYSPGRLYPTEQLITIDGATVYQDDAGRIDFTTVSSKKATVLEWALARFDPAVQLVPAELVDGDKPPDETRRINLEMMQDAKRDAEVVALRKLGYQVKVDGTGALVASVSQKSPAATAGLNRGDAIVAIDDKPIKLGDELVAELAARRPGDTVTLEVESAPGEPVRVITATLASRCDPDAIDACTDENRQRPLLGVGLTTRDTKFSFPFKVTVDTKEVGGPSAGLALTLGIIDVLTPGSLTGGKHVATTGTIDLNGNVGPIGGIQQKTYLAERNGIDLFLVPTAEYTEALKYAGAMKVVAVTNLDDALRVLAENGGRTDVVQEAAGARR